MEAVFKFGTKSETLEKISPFLKLSKTPKQIYFSTNEWEINKNEISDKIINLFKSSKIAVRSSSFCEDSNKFSNAGYFDSVLNVFPEKEDIIQAVEKVIKSYEEDHGRNINDQVLIQEMIENVYFSGVLFTRYPVTGAPYYVINYDDSSGKTDTVTSGTSGELKTFTFFRYSEKMPENQNLNKLLSAVIEIEKITGSECLDIEFGINRDSLFIFQVRPITTINNINLYDEKLKQTVKNIKDFFESNNRKFPNLYGYKALFGYMPDWNPAEIIGDSPKPLAFSLYRELITDYIWPLSRKEVGYKDVGYHPGVVSIGGKPYVDVRLSFNTFVPEKISDTTAEKLVNFYIDKLINNPELHDKIEFYVAYTCYKLGFEKEEEVLRQNQFSSLQIKEIKEALVDLTNKIVNEEVTSIDFELSLNKSLEEKRKRIINSDVREDIKISQLIHDCKFYGTLPFSKLARFAFVGNIILKSLVELGVLEKEEREAFFRGINSVATEFLNKLEKLKSGEISKDEFLTEFGHLRPGTYDLCSPTYKENFEGYFDLTKKDESPNNFEKYLISDDKINKISELLKNSGLSFSAERLLDFAERALSAREKSKFEFTKNLSLILDYCYDHMHKYGFTKEDTTFLDVKDIIIFSHSSRSINEVDELIQKINKNKEAYKITLALKLPPLIYLSRNADYFHQFDNRPNYITNKIIINDIFFLDSNSSSKDLNNKIVVTNNADPGYDWIFSHNIAGLITKYGGVGSHMAIRCSEFNLPAAIGCGATIFDYINNFKKIKLDCLSGKIEGIS